MTKKLAILFAIIASIVLSIAIPSFATEGMVENAAEGARNIVGGAENAVEDGVKGTAEGVRSGLNTAGEAAKNTADSVKNTMTGNHNRSGVATTNNNNGNYTATRTSANATFMGMTGTMWTWLVMGITGIAIVALIWYYGSSRENNISTASNNHDDNRF